MSGRTGTRQPGDLARATIRLDARPRQLSPGSSQSAIRACRVVSLGEDLADRVDWDGAVYHLGRSLGAFQNRNFQTGIKRVFWTDNDLGNGLRDALLVLARAQVLDRREDPDEQVRWHRT